MFKQMIFVSLLGLICLGTLTARELKVSLAQMPVYAESLEKGVLVDFAKALAAASGSSLNMVVVPFKRSMDNVITKQVDLHMPLIKNPLDDEAKLPYSHSTATIFHVNFVIYSNKNKPLDMANLKQYKLETDAAHVPYFDFNPAPSTSIEGSLKKVDAGRIDGFVFADFACDPIVKGQALNNIKRALYKRYDVKIILPKGAQNGEIDKLLSEAIKKMTAAGSFVKIMGPIDTNYVDWQPGAK